jgi:calcium-dependent protein kinase
MGSMIKTCCDRDNKQQTERQLSNKDTELPENSVQHTNLKPTINPTNRDILVNKSMFINYERGSPNDNYILAKTLGEGAYGIVIKATHKLTKSTRAIKVIKKMGENKETEITNEINMLTMIDHPNIIKIFEFYVTKSEYFIVTEFCQGGELFDKIIEAAPLEEEFAASIMYQILSAVHYCHKMGIIHRDLKPENILLNGNEKKNMMIKIIDFGTAKIFDRNINENKMIGSCYYMAPEVLSKNYNEKCDLWSCGVILYILLTGEAPFNGHNDEEIMNRIIKGVYNMNKSNILKLSEEAKDLINCLLIYNPINRISAEEAVKHPWFTKFNTKNNINFVPENKIKDLITNIKNYNPGFILQQAALGFLVHNYPQMEDVIEASKLFNLIDTNGDGIIVKLELLDGLRNMLYLNGESHRLKEDVEKIFKILDSDENGYLEYGEFVRAAVDRTRFLNNSCMKFAFNRFDTYKEGSINIKDVREVFGKFGNIDEGNFAKIISDVDLNGDGIISFSEFDTMMKNILK